MVRTASLIVALLTATAIASRISDDAVAAHQICMQVLPVPRAVARRARDRRPGDGRTVPRRVEHARRARRRPPAARARRGRRACCSGSRSWCCDRGWRASFTNDAGVRHLVLEVLWIVAALQPLAAVVFVLDGVLIGAGDAGYLALAMLVATVGVYLPAALLVAELDGGLLWLWGALVAVDAGPLRGHGRPLPHDPLGGRRRHARA